MRNIWVTRYLGPNMVSNLPSSEKVKILLFVHAFPKDNFKKDIFKSEVLYNLTTFFCEDIHQPLNFHIIKDSEFAPNSHLKSRPVWCYDMKDTRGQRISFQTKLWS